MKAARLYQDPILQTISLVTNNTVTGSFSIGSLLDDPSSFLWVASEGDSLSFQTQYSDCKLVARQEFCVQVGVVTGYGDSFLPDSSQEPFLRMVNLDGPVDIYVESGSERPNSSQCNLSITSPYIRVDGEKCPSLRIHIWGWGDVGGRICDEFVLENPHDTIIDVMPNSFVHATTVNTQTFHGKTSERNLEMRGIYNMVTINSASSTGKPYDYKTSLDSQTSREEHEVNLSLDNSCQIKTVQGSLVLKQIEGVIMGGDYQILKCAKQKTSSGVLNGASLSNLDLDLIDDLSSLKQVTLSEVFLKEMLQRDTPLKRLWKHATPPYPISKESYYLKTLTRKEKLVGSLLIFIHQLFAKVPNVYAPEGSRHLRHFQKMTKEHSRVSRNNAQLQKTIGEFERRILWENGGFTGKVESVFRGISGILWGHFYGPVRALTLLVGWIGIIGWVATIEQWFILDGNQIESYPENLLITSLVGVQKVIKTLTGVEPNIETSGLLATCVGVGVTTVLMGAALKTIYNYVRKPK